MVKNCIKPSRHNIRSYSTKLVNIYNTEENLCELSAEEKPVEKCNCNMDKFKNCFIF